MRNNKHKEQGWREAQGKYIDKVLGRPQRSAGITEVVQTVEGQQKWVGGKKELKGALKAHFTNHMNRSVGAWFEKEATAEDTEEGMRLRQGVADGEEE